MVQKNLIEMRGAITTFPSQTSTHLESIQEQRGLCTLPG